MHVVNRFGSVRTLQVGSVTAIAGLVVVVIAPHTWVVVAVGLALLGLGIAPMIPLALEAADRAPALASGTGLAVAATVMRLGFLASPLLLGIIAETAGLRIAIAVCLLTASAVPLLAGQLRDTAPADNPPWTTADH